MQQKSAATERTQKINERLYARNIPSTPLQPYIDARPVPTKYVLMPIIDQRRPVSVPLHQEPVFNTQTMFDPGNAPGPWSGFATQINTESALQNRIYAIQKCDTAAYIPDSSSDLYRVNWVSPSAQTSAHSLLFNGRDGLFSDSSPIDTTRLMGTAPFNHSTRHARNE